MNPARNTTPNAASQAGAIAIGNATGIVIGNATAIARSGLGLVLVKIKGSIAAPENGQGAR
jgi:hypothetical protein